MACACLVGSCDAHGEEVAKVEGAVDDALHARAQHRAVGGPASAGVEGSRVGREVGHRARAGHVGRLGRPAALLGARLGRCAALRAAAFAALLSLRLHRLLARRLRGLNAAWAARYAPSERRKRHRYQANAKVLRTYRTAWRRCGCAPPRRAGCTRPSPPGAANAAARQVVSCTKCWRMHVHSAAEGSRLALGGVAAKGAHRGHGAPLDADEALRLGAGAVLVLGAQLAAAVGSEAVKGQEPHRLRHLLGQRHRGAVSARARAVLRSAGVSRVGRGLAGSRCARKGASARRPRARSGVCVAVGNA